MKKTSGIWNQIILTIVFSFSVDAFSSVSEPPEEVAKVFYKLYLNGGDKADSNVLRDYVSEKLISSVNHSLECNYDLSDSLHVSNVIEMCNQKRECREYKGNYICKWDGVWVESDVDYFIKSQDIYPSWRKNINVLSISHDEKKSVMKVSLGDGADPVMNLRVRMVLSNNTWRLISVMEWQ